MLGEIFRSVSTRRFAFNNGLLSDSRNGDGRHCEGGQDALQPQVDFTCLAEICGSNCDLKEFGWMTSQ